MDIPANSSTNMAIIGDLLAKHTLNAVRYDAAIAGISHEPDTIATYTAAMNDIANRLVTMYDTITDIDTRLLILAAVEYTRTYGNHVHDDFLYDRADMLLQTPGLSLGQQLRLEMLFGIPDNDLTDQYTLLIESICRQDIPANIHDIATAAVLTPFYGTDTASDTITDLLDRTYHCALGAHDEPTLRAIAVNIQRLWDKTPQRLRLLSDIAADLRSTHPQLAPTLEILTEYIHDYTA